ncbi:MAG TPA: hypothetical protein VJ326_04470 [Thermoplasmata archaeon]|nr:hypothetical protein [Thermoplasmata archaeon]
MAPSFGPPSVPYVPPPTLQQLVVRTRLRMRERERIGGRIADGGAILYLLSMPLAMIAIKAQYEVSIGQGVDWPVFFNRLLESGLGTVAGIILAADTFLLVWTFAASYFVNLDKAAAAFGLIASGGFAILFHAVYVGNVEALAGIAGGVLSVLGGTVALVRPAPGTWSHL